MTADNSTIDSPDTPVGSGDYTVQQGDCIASIAYEHGLFWKTLWNDPANADLKQTRKSPFLLLPGDLLTIPPIKVKDDPAASDQRHTYLLKGVPAVVRIKILQAPTVPPPPNAPPQQKSQDGVQFVIDEPQPEQTPPKPAANIPYDLFIDNVIGPSGTTDGDGLLVAQIKPDARQLLIRLEPKTPRTRSLTITLGGLDPLDSHSGQAQRLANLGYQVDPSGQDLDALQQALALFQKLYGLTPTGDPDSATFDKLKQIHGS